MNFGEAASSNDCCFSFLSLAPMEILNKHNRVLLYVENYRQIRSAGKKVRITSFITREAALLATGAKHCRFTLLCGVQAFQ